MEIIAEIGQNHNGDIKLARELIHSAKDNGAAVAKFQLFDADQIFGRQHNQWYEYNRRSQLKREDVFELADECAKVGIEFMASAFDVKRVQWLEELKVRRYKIASRSINNRELIEAILKTAKPIIVSLGHWHGERFPEINSSAPVDFLYCISEYPAKLEALKLGSVDFNKFSGFSDHTVGITAALIALTRGAKIIEKHFTLDKNLYGPDHCCSMTPKELKQIHDFCIELEKCV